VTDFADGDCLTCRHNSSIDQPIRDRIWRSEHWRVAHAFDTALPGWLVVLSRRHVVALDELEPEAAAELGPLLQRLTAALRATTGCEKTYVMMLGEAEGFSHLHLHVVPRMPDHPEDSRGARVFDLLGVDEEIRVCADARDTLAQRLQTHLGEA
jgi:diadenosine tetraphosphate (Ap4A) HIT family hydrolase